MAQMPIQLLATRANQFPGPMVGQGAPMAPPPPQAPQAPGRGTSRAGAYLIDAGRISGNALRPGAMDQAQFKTLLAAAQKPSAQASDPVPETTAAAQPGRGAAPKIPTLTPAQLAALGAIEAPPTAAAEPPAILATPSIATVATAVAVDPAPEPTSELNAESTPIAPGPMPRARKGADGVWELPRPPSRDERDILNGQKWRVVEDPRSTRLFLGEDGRFGWDDFIDLINPLQHIPLVNIAYRAITGDEINGAARLIDFAFGPVAGVSTALDLAFRDIAGDSMAGTAVAALFGNDESGDRLPEYTTAAATQVADAELTNAQLADIGIAGTGRQGSHR